MVFIIAHILRKQTIRLDIEIRPKTKWHRDWWARCNQCSSGLVGTSLNIFYCTYIHFVMISDISHALNSQRSIATAIFNRFVPIYVHTDKLPFCTYKFVWENAPFCWSTAINSLGYSLHFAECEKASIFATEKFQYFHRLNEHYDLKMNSYAVKNEIKMGTVSSISKMDSPYQQMCIFKMCIFFCVEQTGDLANPPEMSRFSAKTMTISFLIKRNWNGSRFWHKPDHTQFYGTSTEMA